MNRIVAKRLLIGLAACFFVISTILTFGCAGTKIQAEYERKDDSGHSKVEHKHKKGGPPAHAKAHGYRAKHQYRYYPSSNVYKDTERGIYFYLKGDMWEVGASLPLPLKEGLEESVSLELETDKPYIHHAEHAKKYPPKKAKLKKSKKGKKWAPIYRANVTLGQIIFCLPSRPKPGSGSSPI